MSRRRHNHPRPSEAGEILPQDQPINQSLYNTDRNAIKRRRIAFEIVTQFLGDPSSSDSEAYRLDHISDNLSGDLQTRIGKAIDNPNTLTKDNCVLPRLREGIHSRLDMFFHNITMAVNAIANTPNVNERVLGTKHFIAQTLANTRRPSLLGKEDFASHLGSLLASGTAAPEPRHTDKEAARKIIAAIEDKLREGPTL